MNRKIILLPLALSALVLAGCGEAGTSSTSSEAETSTSTTTSSQPVETPTSSEPVETPTSSEPVDTPTSSEPVDTPTSSESSSTPTSSEPATATITAISDLKKGDVATVRGEVVAKSKSAVIIHDGVAGLYIYGNDYPATVTVGDYVEVNGSVSSYNGLLQMAFSGTVPATITKIDGQIEGTVPAATALTAEIANAWTTETLTQADVKAYTWRATAGVAGGKFTTLNIDGCSTDIEPAYHDYEAMPIDTGKTYDVTAYFVGYYNYISILVTDVKEVTSTEEPDPEPEPETWKTLEQVKALVNETEFTARAYWMGTCGKASEDYGTYNTSYVADGEIGYIIYRADAAKIDALSLEAGKTVVEFSGKVSNYTDEKTGEVKTYECTLNDIKVVDDATGLEAPVMLSLNAENPDFTFDATTQSRRIAIADAKVVSNETGSYDNVTVTFTVGTGTTEYEIFFDSRYTDTSLVADLGAGDTFTCESFVGSTRFESIDKLVVTSEGGSTEEPDPEPETLPTPIDTTIAEALNGGLSTTTLYKVTGIIEAMEGDDYGNAMLVDPETGDYITIYGNTTTMSAFTVSDGKVSYTNPKDAKTTLVDIHDGEEITVLCLYDYHQYTSTHELLCVTTEHAAYEGTVDINVPSEIENATASASKTEAAWGEEITIAATASENYSISSVTIDHGYEKETLTTAPYTFKARGINNVTVSVYNPSLQTSLDITSSTLGLSGSYGNGDTAIGGVSISYTELMNGGNCIQMRNKNNNNSAIWNTTAIAGSIASVTINWDTSKANNAKAALAVNFGTEAILEDDMTSKDVAYVSGNDSVVVECDVENATYFRINHGTTSGSFYITSIEINFAA